MGANELAEKASHGDDRSLRLHRFYKGKIQILPKCPISELADFAIWYTPGVAAPCTAIKANADLVYEYPRPKGKSPTAVFFYEQTPEALIEAVRIFEKYEFNREALVRHAQEFGIPLFKQRLRKIIENAARNAP